MLHLYHRDITDEQWRIIVEAIKVKTWTENKWAGCSKLASKLRTAGWWLRLYLTATVSFSFHLYESPPHMMSPSFTFYLIQDKSSAGWGQEIAAEEEKEEDQYHTHHILLITKNNGKTDAKYVMPYQCSTVLLYKLCNMYSVSAWCSSCKVANHSTLVRRSGIYK